MTWIAPRNLYYLACPDKDCLKKVESDNNGQYYCEKCQKAYPAPSPRFIGRVKINDHTGSMWAQFGIQEIAEKIVGLSAMQCWEMDQESEETLIEK